MAKKKAKKATAAAKKTAPKAKVAKKAAPKVKVVKVVKEVAKKREGSGVIKPAMKPRTKSEILEALADFTGFARKEISMIFEALDKMIGSDIAGKPGLFTVPGLMKIIRQHKPAVPARKGVNPFTGEPTVFKAKPARNVVKIRPLKGLKNKL